MLEKNNNILNLYIFANTNKYDIKTTNKERNFSSAEICVLACIDAVARHAVYSNEKCDWNVSKVIRYIVLNSLKSKMYPINDKYRKLLEETDYDSSIESKMANISIDNVRNKKETNQIINNFNNNYLKLQKIIKQVHIYLGVKGDRIESILEHIYGTLIIIMGIEIEYNYKIDFDKLLTMLLLHETEKINANDIFKDFKNKKYYISLLDEFNKQNTLESKYAYMCDNLEYDMQVKIYEMLNKYDYNNLKNNIDTKSNSIRKIIEDGADKVFDICYENDKNRYNSIPCMRGILELTKKM